MDEITLKVEGLYKCCYFDGTEGTIHHFNQIALPMMMKLLNERQKDCIGWYQCNIGNSAALSREIVSAFMNNQSDNPKSALFMVIDAEKSHNLPKYPCMEFYDLRIAKSTDLDSTIAFVIT